MNKKGTLLRIMGIAPLIAGLYGILHDQLTYTISPEYYTKFKFYQFGLMATGNEAILLHPRLNVSLVGFLATWWMGLPIGFILGLVGSIHPNSQQMIRATVGAIIVTSIVAFATGLLGLAYGTFFLADTDVNWWFPDNLIDRRNFIGVGTMHDFSYLGGLPGLLAGISYSLRKKRTWATIPSDEYRTDGH